MCFPLHGKFELAQHQLLVKNTRAAQMITANKPHSQPRRLMCPLRVHRVHIEDNTGSTLRTITGFSEKSVSSSEILEYGNSLLHIKKNEDFYERLFIKSQRLPNCSWMEINEQAWLADCVPRLQADGVKPWSTSIHLSLLIWLSTLILSVWRDHFATLLVWPEHMVKITDTLWENVKNAVCMNITVLMN